MKNNRLLKTLLLTTCCSMLLFLASFLLGLHFFDNINDMYSATLPFLFIAVACLAIFGLKPNVNYSIAKTAKPTATPKAEVVSLRAYRHKYESMYAIRKIS